MQVLSVFYFGVFCLVPLWKSQVSFGLSLLPNFQEPDVLPRASLCSYTLLIYFFYSPWSYSFLATRCLLPVILLTDPMQWTWGIIILQPTFSEVFTHFGVPSWKSSTCAFHKGHESRAHTKFRGVKVSNKASRMRVSCLSLIFLLYAVSSRKAIISIVSPEREVTSENHNDLLLFCPAKNFTWKLPVSAAFPHGRRISQCRPMQCGNKPFIKPPTLSKPAIFSLTSWEWSMQHYCIRRPSTLVCRGCEIPLV